MSGDTFSQQESCEWTGTFWFPDAPELPELQSARFSGKVSYSPEHGIRLTLSMPPSTSEPFANTLSNAETISKKVLHGLAFTDSKLSRLTLFNVHLRNVNPFGEITGWKLGGSAAHLVIGELMADAVFDRISFEYDEYFDQFLSFDQFRETNILSFGKEPPLPLPCGLTVEINSASTGRGITLHDIDTLFICDEETHDQLKTTLSPLINNKTHSVFLRKTTRTRILFKKEKTRLSDFLVQENWFRFYFETLIDHPISIKNTFVSIKPQNSDNYHTRPALFSYHTPRPKKHKPQIFPFLPINLDSFRQTQDETRFSDIGKPVAKWLETGSDPKWEPVTDGIRNLLENKFKLASRPHYVSLLSDIETFLNLTAPENKANADSLIGLYASPRWKKELAAIFDAASKNQTETGSKNKTLGQWIHETRNAIVHPKKAEKKNSKYWRLVQDDLTLQKIHAYVSGLFIKSVLSHIGGINQDHLEKYIEKFIESRASFEPIQYK